MSTRLCDLTPVEACTRLSGTIVNRGLEVDFRPIINLIYANLTLKTGDDKSPLAIMRPTAPLVDGHLLRHRYYMLTRHLSRLEPALQRVEGLIIATHID